MFARIATVLSFAAAAVTAAALVACSGSTDPAPAGASQLAGSSDNNEPERASENGEDGALAAEDGGTSTGKGSKDGKPTDETPADPACVASCQSGLEAKCEGDETFCEDICKAVPAGHLACLIEAPSCAKSEWTRCAEENPSPNAGDAGKK